MDQLQPDDPQQIGQYRISARLGVGGMGKVFLGKSPGGRLVAVKVVHREHAADEAFRTRFRREVTAMRSVSGVFTAPVIDADLDCAEPWLATAYIPGPSLAEALTKAGPLPASSVLVLASGLGEALAAIHGAGLAHRDLKPSNVLLADDGPKVIDFGLAVTRQSSALTQAGTVMGTIGYMSPEQVEGKPVGPASDVFSYGVVLVHAVTGRLPFGGESTGAVLYAILNGEPDLMGVDGPLLAIVTACLKKDAAERPTASQLMSMLSERAIETAVPKGGWLPVGVTQLATVIPPVVPPQGAVPQQSVAPPQTAPSYPPLPDPKHPYLPQRPSYQPGHQAGVPQNPYGVPTTPPHAAPNYQPPGYQAPGYQAPAYGNPAYGSAPVYPVDYGFYGAPPAMLPPLAHWGHRVAAALLDKAIAYVPVAVLIAFAIASIQNTTNEYGDATVRHPAVFAVLVFLTPLYVLVIGIIQLTLQGRTGASLGKRMVGLRLVSARTLQPIGFWACLGRQICHIADNISLYIGWLAPLWTARRQTFADMMVDTVVIKV